jgi:DNA-binding beta-propeller fold protein YncE
MRIKVVLQSSVIMMALLITGNAIAQTDSFRLLKKTIIGGNGGWDYLSVDHENNRLYLSHDTQVEVRDLRTHEKIGVITGTLGVHGIIAVPGAGRGITTNGKANNATVFDLKTLKPIIEIPAGKNPDALLYDEYSDRVFIFNHSDVTATAIDIGDAKTAGTVELGGTGLEAGTSDGRGTIFVNLEDESDIVSFDAKTLAFKNRWKISPGEEPTGLAMDRETRRLFTVCHNEMMMIINADDGKVVTQVPIGKHVDGVVFDPQLKLVFTSNGEGTVTVVQEISPDEYKVAQTIITQPGARTLALDPVTHHIFLTTAKYGSTASATTENPRTAIIPGTFMLLEYGVK